jgi:Holliday junction resolvase|tara:strand:+ start:331 stop:771 length:441 start_codon:yes stop_codon:yes gene_type:complete
LGKINSQAKGKRAEREVAKLINKYLDTNVRRTPQSGGLSIKGDIIDINPDSAAYKFHFEVKDQKKLMIPKWWEQIDDDCPLAKTPVNVFKMNSQFYATMQFTDWLSLLAEIEELKESNRGLEEEVEDRTHKYNLLLRKSEDQSDND